MTKLINDHRQHLYNGDINSGKTFEKGEVIPEGYFDRPNATEWDNKPLPIDQWPRKVEPEPAPIYVSPPTPLEHEEPINVPAPKPPEKFDPFPVTNKDLMTLKKHELVSILESKGIAADAGLHIAKLRAMARKVYKK
jgi:hypothetical protein